MTIDVRELRIGNCLLLRGKVVPVGGIPNCMCLLIPGEQYAVDIEDFNSIPLTAEILLRCGFTCDAISDCFDKLNLRVRILGNSIYVFVGSEVGFGKEWHDANIEIKSLHQLQNLYFALTGKELEANI